MSSTRPEYIRDVEEAATAFKNAIWGEDVRDGLVDVANAVAWAIEQQIITVDRTLTQRDQGADAEVVGNMFARAMVNRGILLSGSFNSLPNDNGVWSLASTQTYTAVPSDLSGTNFAGVIMQVRWVGYDTKMQLLFVCGGDTYTRIYGTAWEDWHSTSDTIAAQLVNAPMFKGTLASGTNILTGVNETSIYYLAANSNYDNSLPNNYTHVYDGGFLLTVKTSGQMQVKILIGEGGYLGVNKKSSEGTWRGWIEYTTKEQLDALKSRVRYLYYEAVDYERGQSANNFTQNGIYFVSNNADYPNGTITDLPYTPCWFETTRATAASNVLRQMVYPYSLSLGHHIMQRVRRPDSTWSAWYEVGGGGGSVVNNNTYTITENTYNVTATPTINSGIPYVLQSTGDTTDRTSAIATMLATTGTCYLGPGDFYVSNLTIPEGTTLRGSGIRTTRLRLIPAAETTDVYTVALGSTSCLSDMSVLDDGTAQETIGKRHGIAWQGTYIDADNPGTYPIYGSISNVEIRGFTGAGILCSNTSMVAYSGMNVSNVHIHVCSVGIYIRKYSEYSRFTNVNVCSCHVGCINNGGNNMFVNCAFNDNVTGFRIDDTSGQSPNNSHGGCVGCTINHNSNSAVQIVGADYGWLFDGCQIHYGACNMIDSVGVVFANCNIGKSVSIRVQGGGITLFNACTFRAVPQVSKINATLVSNSCYKWDGEAISL